MDLVQDDSCGGIGICFANFTWTVSQNGLGDCEVTFTDASIAGAPIVSWIWDFGDQTSWNGPTPPTHLYLGTSAYYACLTIVTADGCSSQYCDWVGCIRGNERHGGTQELDTPQWRIYPNPSSGLVTISHDFDINSVKAMQVYDLRGRLIRFQTISSSQSQLNVSDLKSGMYTVELVGDGGRLGVKKLIVNP